MAFSPLPPSLIARKGRELAEFCLLDGVREWRAEIRDSAGLAGSGIVDALVTPLRTDFGIGETGEPVWTS